MTRRDHLSEDDLASLFEAASGPREKLALNWMLYSGLRVSQLGELSLEEYLGMRREGIDERRPQNYEEQLAEFVEWMDADEDASSGSK